MIKVLYFAGLREAIGTGSEDVELCAAALPLSTLIDHLVSRGEPWVALARTKNLRSAVNHSLAPMDTLVNDGDEVAFFPPVTGG